MNRGSLLVRDHAQGKFYLIECPEVVCRSGSDDHLIVPLNGIMISIPADPSELLPLLAEKGNFGVRMGEEHEERLEGVVCPFLWRAIVARL